MHVAAVVEFFKYKVVSSIIVLTCDWTKIDQIRFARQITQNGMSVTFSCDPTVLSKINPHHFQGVIYIREKDGSLFSKVDPKHFSLWYKWLIIGDKVPNVLHHVRYDADVALLKPVYNHEGADDLYRDTEGMFKSILSRPQQKVFFDDVYTHPRDGASAHPWASWTESSGFQLKYERERILRRHDLKQFPLKIATPMGLYSREWYNGSFQQYLLDDTMLDHDSGIRCGYEASSLIVQSVNATEVVMETGTWSAVERADSMLRLVGGGRAQLSGAHLRVLADRVRLLDYIIPIWPFSTGFTYLAERKSSTNMYVAPFSGGVWAGCAGAAVLLALALRAAARHASERDGAVIGVLATYLQQDASAVPEGLSGRWTFIVLSVSSMLVHAYYTSAVVSALMAGGTAGPRTLRALADSKYTIASESYDYMRLLFFDVKTNWDDLEYLKKKKMTPKLYAGLERGVELVRAGGAAYHTEYTQLYPRLRTFSDDHLCKLQHVDTIPMTKTWMTSSKRGEWTELFRTKGAWVREAGMLARVSARLVSARPACRSALLAERVGFGDVASLLGATGFGALLAFVMLGLEVLFAKLRGRKSGDDGSASLVPTGP